MAISLANRVTLFKTAAHLGEWRLCHRSLDGRRAKRWAVEESNLQPWD
jgi:hypothetical protein